MKPWERQIQFAGKGRKKRRLIEPLFGYYPNAMNIERMRQRRGKPPIPEPTQEKAEAAYQAEQ